MGKQVHRLTEIDKEARTAVCACCGPVRIRRMGSGRTTWRCNTKDRQGRGRRDGRRGGRDRGPAFDKPVCQRCGFVPQHPRQMDRHHRDRNRKNDASANVEVLCANCHRLEHAD